ncbi:MAG: choice-of-anchor B family protein [Bacteroidetes bacterium]|nr:choice-of-anchor B family protein [Bacteroidota bacterium]
MRKSLFQFFVFALFLSWPLSAAGQSGSFGTSVVFEQGELIVAEPNTTFREGSVYVYRPSNNAWSLQQRIVSPKTERADGFGTVLARTGNTLFVGQKKGPVHQFEKRNGNWQHSGTLVGPGTEGVTSECGQYGYCSTEFGITLAAHGDWLFVGAPGISPPRQRDQEPAAEPAGKVHIYRKGTDGTWAHQGHIQPKTSTAGDRFGAVLHVENETALIGSPLWNDAATGLNAVGQVTQFALRGGQWVETGPLAVKSESATNLGTALAVRGDKAYIGAPGWNASQGAVLQFSRNMNGEWIQTGTLVQYDGVKGDRFGSGIGLSGDELWVGAPTLRENLTGSTLVFPLNKDGMISGLPTRIHLEKTVERDAFGQYIVADGSVVAVMAPGMHHQSGAVYLYTDPLAAGEMLVSPPDALGAVLGEKKECVDGKIGPFDCDDVELLSFIPNSILRAPENARGVRTNDNWGWTDPSTDREYALVGRNDGTSFIDITDPSNPVLVGDLPKPWGTPPSQLWRDIKTYKGYAFIVADGAGNHGMQVFDLTRLRDVKDMPALFTPDLHYTLIASSHNIIINEDTGYAYTVDGQTCGGGLYMMNIQEPLNPIFEGCVKGEGGTHDSQCVTYRGPDTRYAGREICLNSNGKAFEIADVTDKANPVHLSRASSPNVAYIHQGWLTDDHKYFYQDDEADVVSGKVPTTRTLVWDLSDLEDPILINEFMGSMPASAHNLYLKDGFAYQANYRYGLHVLDISDPENPVEVGSFDTSPYQEGPGFSGAWSTYPFYKSGTVLVTSLQEGLFVLKKRDTAF